MQFWEAVFVLIIGVAIGVIPVVSLIVPRAKKRSTLKAGKASYEQERVETSVAQKDGDQNSGSEMRIPADVLARYPGANITRLGSAIDYLVFKAGGGKGEPGEIVFLAKQDPNTGLTESQKATRAAVQAGRVRFDVIGSAAEKPVAKKNAVITKRYASDGTSVA